MYLCQPWTSYNNQHHVVLREQLGFILKKENERKGNCVGVSRESSFWTPSVCGALNAQTWSPKIRQADRVTWGHYKTKSLRIYIRVIWRDRALAGPCRVCRRPPRRQPSWPFKGTSNATKIEHQQPHHILALTRSSKDSQKSKTEGCSSHRIYFSEPLLPGVKSTDTASQSLGATPRINGTELGGHMCQLLASSFCLR